MLATGRRPSVLEVGHTALSAVGQHRSELCESTCAQACPVVSALGLHRPGWLNLWVWEPRSQKAKLYSDFQLRQELASQTPALFKGHLISLDLSECGY